MSCLGVTDTVSKSVNAQVPEGTMGDFELEKDLNLTVSNFVNVSARPLAGLGERSFLAVNPFATRGENNWAKRTPTGAHRTKDTKCGA
jgi:hypothetical protein